MRGDCDKVANSGWRVRGSSTRYPYIPKKKEPQNERKRDERVLDDITCSMRRTIHHRSFTSPVA